MAAKDQPVRYCSQPPRIPIVLPASTAPGRAYAIRLSKNKWANGTVLRYHFLDDPRWDWPQAQKTIVHWAFGVWRDLGIGLRFVETAQLSEAEIKVGRNLDDGSWSYVGTDILKNARNGCTMNFGWDLTDEWGKATGIHEIGHTLGFQHEHQSPRAGIVWNEEAVYDHFEQNDDWDHDTTYSNILEKLEANGAEGSDWDPTSVMHYPFVPGLIRSPAPYDTNGIGKNTKLSKFDKQWALHWYPKNAQVVPLNVMEVARFSGSPGEEKHFSFEPDSTRDYQIRTVGTADTKIVLFEMRDGEPRHYDAEDDSGTPDNATIIAKLVAGREYVIRARLHFRPPGAEAGVLIY